jgi:hypothetical protein
MVTLASPVFADALESPLVEEDDEEELLEAFPPAPPVAEEVAVPPAPPVAEALLLFTELPESLTLPPLAEFVFTFVLVMEFVELPEFFTEPPATSPTLTELEELELPEFFTEPP